MKTDSTLVLIPGLLCTPALWAPQVAALSDEIDCLVADITEGASIAEFAARVLSQAPEQFALAGLSLGGIVAQEIMRTAPQRVTRLALLDTTSRPEVPAQTERREALIAMVHSGRFSELPEVMMPSLLHPDRLGDQALTAPMRKMSDDVGAEVFLRQTQAIIDRPDSRTSLHQINVPTLVLCGRQDQITLLEFHQEIAESIPGSILTVLEDCGHISTLEKPQAVNTALRDWLRME